MNYYKIRNATLEADHVDTFAHWTDGEQTVVSDMDVCRAVGFELTPEDVQARYGVEPLTQRQLINVRRNAKWSMNKERN